jgi:hypothetical protein
MSSRRTSDGGGGGDAVVTGVGASDGSQAVVYLADLRAHLHQFLMSLGTGQGFGLFVGVGADVFPPP